MENNVLQFKTNLNCGGCVSKVKSDLDNAKGLAHWEVDIENADKVLTVRSEGITEEQVITLIKGKGFNAEPLG